MVLLVLLRAHTMCRPLIGVQVYQGSPREIKTLENSRSFSRELESTIILVPKIVSEDCPGICHIHVYRRYVRYLLGSQKANGLISNPWPFFFLSSLSMHVRCQPLYVVPVF